MKRCKRIYILLGVLLAVCIATVVAVKYEERQEQIRTSEEVILSLAAEDVQSLSWSYEAENLSFSRGEDGLWYWADDAAFPVSEAKINELLALFESFSVSFAIDEVSDESLYGLAEPVCSISLTTADASYTLKLGDFSKLDSQRYVSLGDGRAFLVSTDPMESFELTIRDMIENDPALDYDAVSSVSFSGSESWSLSYTEEGESLCETDIYFSGVLPLDTYRVDDYLGNMSLLELTNYVSYNATEEELENYGLAEPRLSVSVEYTDTLADGSSESGSYTLHLGTSAEEQAKADAAANGEESDYVAYARVGSSQIIYEISSSEYEKLIAAGYNDLRHREPFTADFASVSAMDISIEGVSCSLSTSVSEDDEETLLWYFEGTEVDMSAVQSALEALSAAEFSAEVPGDTEELRLELQLQSESFPTLEIVLYRYDGVNCLATVDGESFGLIPRSEMVELREALNTIILG